MFSAGVGPRRSAVISEEGDHGFLSAVELRLSKLPLDLRRISLAMSLSGQSLASPPAVALGPLQPLIQRLQRAAYLARY
jgi:hypothetical protein